MDNKSTIIEMVELNEFDLNEISSGTMLRVIGGLVAALITIPIFVNEHKLNKEYPELYNEFIKTKDIIDKRNMELGEEVKNIKKIKKDIGLAEAKKRISKIKSLVVKNINSIDNLALKIKEKMPHKIGPLGLLKSYKKSLIKIDNQCNKFLHK